MFCPGDERVGLSGWNGSSIHISSELAELINFRSASSAQSHPSGGSDKEQVILTPPLTQKKQTEEKDVAITPVVRMVCLEDGERLVFLERYMRRVREVTNTLLHDLSKGPNSDIEMLNIHTLKEGENCQPHASPAAITSKENYPHTQARVSIPIKSDSSMILINFRMFF